MLKDNVFQGLQTVVSYPEGFEETKKYPLVVFLHGAGTRCNDLEILKRNACFTNLRLHQDRGYLLAAPLCQVHDWNEVMETVIAWIDSLRELPYVDVERVYLTGNSMGGYGTWELACIHPEWFAAIMPVCGGGICWFTSRLTEIPIRTFHGLCDTVVDPIDSLQMAKAVNMRGGHCELILYPHLDHNCWDTVYTTEENYDWLLSHTRRAEKTEEEPLSGEIYG